MGPEVGGANGLCALPLAASLNLPVVDADTMGRAFPRIDMSLPYVFEKAVPWPAVFADARAEVHVIKDAQNHRHFEDLGRDLSVKLGSSAAMALNPMRAEIVQRYCCLGSLSLAWFIGREVVLARQRKSNPAKAVVGVVPCAGSGSDADIPCSYALPGVNYSTVERSPRSKELSRAAGPSVLQSLNLAQSLHMKLMTRYKA